MGTSIHDNTLLGYEVDHRARIIRLRTVFGESTAPDFTDALFLGVVAYEFVHDSLETGTILFSIDEEDAAAIVKENAAKFESGRKYGWPGDWNSSLDAATQYLMASKVKGFGIYSSLGLSGWVLAESLVYESGRQQKTAG